MGDHDRYPVVLPQTPDRPVRVPPILFPCPYCNTEVKARGDWSGKTTTCLGCGNKVIVPLPLPVPPSAPAAIPRGRTVEVDSGPIPLSSFVPADRPRSHSRSRSLWLVAAGVLAAVALGAAGKGDR